MVAPPDALYQPFPMLGRARGHIWRYAPENRRPRHFHPEPELNLVAAGSGKFGMGQSVISVGAGDLLWWPPGQDHVLLDASPDFDLFVVGLHPGLSARVLGDSTVSAYSGAVKVRLSPASLSKLGALCASPMDRQGAAVVEQHVGEIWREAHLLRTGAPEMHTLTRRALVSLLDRPHLGRAEVAVRVGGYPTEVSRYFHRDMGLTLTAYRTRLRLLRFVQAVDDGAGNLLSAALDAGFGSYSQCHRVFQNTLGCTPRVFFGTGARAGERDRMGEVFSPWMVKNEPARLYVG